MRARSALLLVLTVAACSQPVAPDTPPGTATVVEVIDGDTLVVDIDGAEEHVRLIGIDTPETHKPDSPIECYGEEAAAHLAELLPPGTDVRLERDVEARDRFDRLLVYLYRADDNLFVNLDLAAGGWAAVLTIPPNVAHTDDFVAAVADARAADRGLWAACGGPDTPVGDG